MGRALIVSAGASSNEYISARLTELGYARPIIVPSAAEARRRMLESDFELIVVNSPLPDEFGHELCADAVEKTDAGVIFLAKAAAAEQLLTPLSEEGVLLVTKPFSNTFFLQAIHMAAASNHRLLLLRHCRIVKLFFPFLKKIRRKHRYSGCMRGRSPENSCPEKTHKLKCIGTCDIISTTMEKQRCG